MTTQSSLKYIIHLSETLNSMSKGNLQQRALETREDELGSIAYSINRMAQQLDEQIRKERELQQGRMDWIAGLSHDIRTPLTSMMGYIGLLKTGAYENEDEQQRFIDNTYNKVVQLKSLTDELFEYSRLTGSSITLDLRQIDIKNLLSQMLVEFEPLARKHELDLETVIPDEPLLLMLDPDMIVRALDNLFMNTLKYSVKPGTVKITLAYDQDQVRIEIENRGGPLLPESVSRLFDQFYKADSSRSSDLIQTGAGLGLSITRTIVEMHGGSADLHYEDGTFIFSINLPQSEA
nr:HAMP domain-containing sensor histidine kinase [Paenibacillus lemnae]